MALLTRRHFGRSLGPLALVPAFVRARSAAQGRSLHGIAPPSEAALGTLAAVMNAAGVPGLAAAIVRVGQPAWYRHIGVADAGTLRPVTPDTMFPAASLAKPVSAWVALRLADRGLLDLDRPLKAYVPDHAPSDPRADLVTARHVLSHTSGFRNWRNNASQPLVPEFDPGSRFQYSGEGFYYLQRAMEKAAGRGFEQVVQDELFAPLGMTSSTFAWRADAGARLVTGHTRGAPVNTASREFAARLFAHAASLGRPLASFTHDDIVAAMSALQPAPAALPNFIVPNAAASLLTTTSDYVAFLTRLLSPDDGTSALRATSRQAMLAPAIRLTDSLSWGLGWGLERPVGAETYEYLWQWGDNGPFKNFVLAHPATRSAVLVFTNASNGLRVCEALITAAIGHDLRAFDWV